MIATHDGAALTGASARPSSGAFRARRWLTAAAAAYVLGLHALIGVMLAESNFLKRLERRLGLDSEEEFDQVYWDGVDAARQADSRSRPGSLLFIGDSLIRKLDTSSIADRTLNLSISGETTARLLQRIGDYRSLRTARGLVLGVGVNDLRFRSIPEAVEKFASILARIPQGMPVIVVGVLPVDEQVRKKIRSSDTRRLNEGFASLCAQRPRCHFVPPSPQLMDAAGNLRAAAHNGNGLHLSVLGHDLYWAEVNRAVAQFVPPPEQASPAR